LLIIHTFFVLSHDDQLPNLFITKGPLLPAIGEPPWLLLYDIDNKTPRGFIWKPWSSSSLYLFFQPRKVMMNATPTHLFTPAQEGDDERKGKGGSFPLGG